MAEHVIAVRIAIRRHSVSNLVKIFHGLAFADPSQIPFQAQIRIGLACLNRLVKRAFLRSRLVPFYGCRVDQVNLLIFLPFHSAENPCGIQGVLGFGHKAVLDAAQPSLDGLFPFFIYNVKQIGKDFHMNGPAILTAQFALKLRPGAFERLPVWLAVML